MDRQANVTLKALSGDISLAERNITLNAENRTIRIGRASKSASKGILGAPDNAWFDSPVMSRDHANMCLNTDLNIVTIHDIGSMHGTTVNDRQLLKEELITIADGDEITFGAEVKRGPETFPACAFKVKLQFVPYKASNSYSYPEDSEAEEEQEEDYNISDDHMEGANHYSSEDDVSIELQSPAKSSQAMHAIDLTRDDSPSISSSNPIDLTSETPGESHTHNMTYAVSGFMHAEDPIVLESEDEDDDFGHFSSDSEDQLVMADSTDSDSSDDEILPEIDDTESEDDAEGEDVDPVLEGYTENSLENPQENFLRNGMDQYVVTGHDLNVTTSDKRGRFEVPEESDDDSDFGLSDAGAEGIRALFEGGLLHSDSDASELSSRNEVQAGLENADMPQIVSPSASLGPEWETAAVSLLCKAATLNPPAKHNNMLNQGFSGERQPSPSDAAMVKTNHNAPIKRPEQTATDVPVYHLQSPPFGQLTQTIAMGDKTGKRAFFEAREYNKAKVNAKVHTEDDSADLPCSFSAGGHTLFSKIQVPENTTTFQPSTSNTSDDSAQLGNFSRFAGSSSATAKTEDYTALAPTSSTFSFEIQDQLPALKRAPSPEYDMTSAVTFNESKAESARSKLSIGDIIETISNDQPSVNPGPQASLKRKAGDISEVIESEIREWASMEASNSSEIASSNSKATIPGSMALQASEQRPTKKLKTILERAAYAAAGGFAVGATLFLGLVATAPDFV